MCSQRYLSQRVVYRSVSQCRGVLGLCLLEGSATCLRGEQFSQYSLHRSPLLFLLKFLIMPDHERWCGTHRPGMAGGKISQLQFAKPIENTTSHHIISVLLLYFRSISFHLSKIVELSPRTCLHHKTNKQMKITPTIDT